MRIVCGVAVRLTLRGKERGHPERKCEQMARGSTEEEMSLKKKKSLNKSNILLL